MEVRFYVIISFLYMEWTMGVLLLQLFRRRIYGYYRRTSKISAAMIA